MLRRAFTLMELLVVLAVATMLLAILAPTFGGAREAARLAACAANLRSAQTAMLSYSAQNCRLLPPFAISDYTKPDVQASGHWMGATGPADPAAFGRTGGWQSVRNVNLGILREGKFLSPQAVICPGAGKEPPGRWSSYCTRVPTSADLASDGLVPGGGPRLAVYLSTAGGWPLSWGGTSPQVRIDWTYRLDADVSCGDGNFEPATEAVLSDAFWWPRAEGSPLGAAWPHRQMLNVAAAGGVRTYRDDGAVAACAAGSPPGDGAYGATLGERVWQKFDGR